MTLAPRDLVALVTAAGASTRMGSPKALVPWGGRPLVVHQATVLSDLRDVVVVLGHDAPAIAAAAPLPPPARYLVHPGWAEGRSSSLEAAARALPDDAAAILVCAVDQPLARATLDALLAAFDPERHDLAQPLAAGRPGHPLLLSARLLPALRAATTHPEGLRDIVRAAHPRTVFVPCDDPGVHTDLNTPAALAAARPPRP